MADSAEPRKNLNAPSSPPTEQQAPLPPHRRTCQRLAKAPLSALSIAAGRVLGDGNRTSLLLAAAACAHGEETERGARDAVQALLQAHKERLLVAANEVLRDKGEPLV